MAKIGEGKYPTVELTNIPNRPGQTSSNTTILEKAFGESPLYKDYDVAALQALAAAELNPKGQGKFVEGNFQFINQSLDYGINIGNDDVPLSNQQNTSLPSSKFTPNLSSTEPGVVDPSKMKEFVLEGADLQKYFQPGGEIGESAGTQRPANPRNNTKITVGSLLESGKSRPSGTE